MAEAQIGIAKCQEIHAVGLRGRIRIEEWDKGENRNEVGFMETADCSCLSGHSWNDKAGTMGATAEINASGKWSKNHCRTKVRNGLVLARTENRSLAVELQCAG